MRTEDSRIVEVYWRRSADAIIETSTKYGNYCDVIAHIFLPARFSDQWTARVKALLAADALLDGCEENVFSHVSIAETGYTIDSGTDLSSAIVSVKHRTSTEEGYGYLTMELDYTDGQ